jgi:hypothetical protein
MRIAMSLAGRDEHGERASARERRESVLQIIKHFGAGRLEDT